MPYRPDLDGLRGIAIALVLLQHLRVPPFGTAGAVGVSLFFVLSGYLITSLLMAERAKTGSVSLRAFYERRARRLLPALLALIVVVGGVMAVQGRLWQYPSEAGVVLFYVANWFPDQLQYLGHTWSLSVEEQFYIAWPLAFLVAARWQRALLVLLVAGIVGSALLRLSMSDPFAISVGTLTRGDALLWGCLLALTSTRLPPAWAMPAWVVLGLLTVSLPHVGLGFTVMAIAATVVVASSSRWYSWAPLIRLGVLSYGIYLWHMPLALMLRPTLEGADGWPLRIAAWVTVAVASVALAAASERWIERRWRRRSQPGPGQASRPVGVVVPGRVLVPDDTQARVRGAHTDELQPQAR